MVNPVGDMLVRINNALMAGRSEVVLPASRFKQNLARLLLKEGFLAEVKTFKEGGKKNLRLVFALFKEGRPVLRQVSKPGKRIYRGARALPVRRGKGITVVSTSRGLLTAVEAKNRKLGGEIVCSLLP